MQDTSEYMVSLNAAKLLQLIFMLTDTLFPKRFSLHLHVCHAALPALAAKGRYVRRGCVVWSFGGCSARDRV